MHLFRKQGNRVQYLVEAHESIDMEEPKRFYIPFNQWLHLVRPWVIRVEQGTGNNNFIKKCEDNPDIEITTMSGGFAVIKQIHLPIGTPIKLVRLNLGDPNAHMPIKLAIPYKTKAGKDSQITCWIGVDQLYRAWFTEAPSDVVEERIPSAEDRFRDLDL